MFKQRKRMISGQNYRAADPELVYARARASRICTRYNRKPFNEIHMRARLMRKLLHIRRAISGSDRLFIVTMDSILHWEKMFY